MSDSVVCVGGYAAHQSALGQLQRGIVADQQAGDGNKCARGASDSREQRQARARTTNPSLGGADSPFFCAAVLPPSSRRCRVAPCEASALRTRPRRVHPLGTWSTCQNTKVAHDPNRSFLSLRAPGWPGPRPENTSRRPARWASSNLRRLCSRTSVRPKACGHASRRLRANGTKGPGIQGRHTLERQGLHEAQ